MFLQEASNIWLNMLLNVFIEKRIRSFFIILHTYLVSKYERRHCALNCPLPTICLPLCCTQITAGGKSVAPSIRANWKENAKGGCLRPRLLQGSLSIQIVLTLRRDYREETRLFKSVTAAMADIREEEEFTGTGSRDGGTAASDGGVGAAGLRNNRPERWWRRRLCF